jgi:hypothetical protein
VLTNRPGGPFGAAARRMVLAMTGAQRDEESRTPEPRRSDAGHLDEDPECLEDPVHCGDAQHQHDLHAAPSGSAEPTPSA